LNRRGRWGSVLPVGFGTVRLSTGICREFGRFLRRGPVATSTAAQHYRLVVSAGFKAFILPCETDQVKPFGGNVSRETLHRWKSQKLPPAVEGAPLEPCLGECGSKPEVEWIGS
jgi:hypothetical protein